MKIHHVAITVKDLEKTKKFYGDFFGFKEYQRFKSKSMPGIEPVLIELGDFKIELWQFPEFKKNLDNLEDLKILGIRHLAFEVDDLDSMVHKFKQSKLHITEPIMGGSGHRFCFTRDPNGVALELYEK